MSHAPALSMRLISEPSNSISLAPWSSNVRSDLSSAAISSMTQSPPKLNRKTEFRRSVRYQARLLDWAVSLRAVPLNCNPTDSPSVTRGHLPRQRQIAELAAEGRPMGASLAADD